MDDFNVLVDVYDGERILITSSNPFRDKELIKMLPGASYSLKEHRWFAPLTWPVCLQLRGIFGNRLVIGDKLRDWAIEERANRVDPAIALRLAWDAEGDADLYPFQRAGVKFLGYAKRALLCDEMGTGKTVQTIRALADVVRNGDNPFPAIVVAPNNMTLTWKAEFEKWFPGVKVNVIKGGPEQCKKLIADPAHVYVINYEKLRTYSRLQAFPGVRLRRCIKCDGTLPDVPANAPSRCQWCKKALNEKMWTSVIIDEAHKMKNPKAFQTMACWALRTPATEYVYCLTGTAIANAPHDLWPALHMIAKEEWPSRTKYIDRYCLTSFNPFGGMNIIGIRHDTKDEFFMAVDPRMRRMPKEAVLPFLPKKTYTTRYVEMSPKQTKAYNQMESDLIALLDGDGEVGSGVTVAVNPLTQLTRLMQFASAYAEMNENGEVRLSVPSNKVDALVEILEELDGEPVVVFAQSRQLIELAAKKLDDLAKSKTNTMDVSYGLIVGGQTPDEREWNKTQFQNGQFRVILCTIAAGGIGITLTRAATAVFLQRSWSMVDNSQAEDRVHRIGSEVHDKVTIVDIVSIGTVEERQRLVLGQKLERLEEVMRDRETLKRILGAK